MKYIKRLEKLEEIRFSDSQAICKATDVPDLYEWNGGKYSLPEIEAQLPPGSTLLILTRTALPDDRP